MPAKHPCLDCGKPVRLAADRCWDCHRARVTKTEHVSERIDPVVNFEPMRVPIETPAPPSRPYNDPRNNYRLPNWNAGLPLRDIEVSPLRVAVTDIETTDLWAGGMGRLLCANTLLYSPDESVTVRADSFAAWKAGKRSDDREVVQEVLRVLEQADVVYAFNGSQFDFPFLRTRALIHGFPPVEPKKIIDPVWLARKIFRFRSNRLDAVAKALGCPFEKTDLDMSIWAQAMLDGDKDAMDQIVHHCEIDVKVLAWVAKRMTPYVRQIDVIGSFRQ